MTSNRSLQATPENFALFAGFSAAAPEGTVSWRHEGAKTYKIVANRKRALRRGTAIVLWILAAMSFYYFRTDFTLRSIALVGMMLAGLVVNPCPKYLRAL